MYAGYILFCNNAVQEECLKNKKYACTDKTTVRTDKIEIGSVLFLYNAETDTLLGPFTALSEGAETVDTGAWKENIDDHSASQNVTLEWEKLHTLTNAAAKMPFLKEPKMCALTSTQIQRALDLLDQAPVYMQAKE